MRILTVGGAVGEPDSGESGEEMRILTVGRMRRLGIMIVERMRLGILTVGSDYDLHVMYRWGRNEDSR